MTDTVTVDRPIAAPAETVWAMISDVTRMGEWSPETTSCSWIGGSSGPAVGAKFKGRNARGKRSWSTTCVVTECEPGRTFGFLVKGGPLDVAHWSYTLTESTDGGCQVTERWEDRRGRLLKATSKPVSGVSDRVSHNRAGMEATLAALAAAAEAS